MIAIRNSILVALALCVSGIAASGPAAAADRHVRIVNDTSYTMMRFYASRSSTSDWEEDILGDSTLGPGESMRVNVDDGTGACNFDFKAVFRDGSSTVREGINVCKIGTYTYSD